ncbi:MAG: TRAP transporter small permease [Desulfobulbaceae bacterium]|jgi:TRAP-type C4-dicarboxylate transport system permease small subunit|nr:TRAP transporter small permease [Desulfobulbaceae bacterium]
MKFFDTAARFLAANLQRLGALCLLAMALLTVADICGRRFGYPIFGAVELVSFLGALVVACAMPVTDMEKRHVRVLLLFNRLPRSVKGALDLVIRCVNLLLFAVISWRMFLFAEKLRASGEVSLNLHLPEYLIVYFLAVCCCVVCLVIFGKLVAPERGRKS